MKPIIGLLCAIDNEQVTSVQSAYVRAIIQAGGTPILLPFTENGETVAEFLQLCHGLLFTGGADIAPHYYGEEQKPACGEITPHRDAFEWSVLNAALQTEKPIMAICRGIQLVNVALGGTLYQDIPSEYSTHLTHRQTQPKFAPSHGVTVCKDTPLFALTGSEKLVANSFHHQAIKALGKGLTVMATAEDGIIEAVYLPGRRYLRAYQWHPERLCDTDPHNALLFKDFIAACKEKHNRKGSCI